jgi:hypothetical protein
MDVLTRLMLLYMAGLFAVLSAADAMDHAHRYRCIRVTLCFLAVGAVIMLLVDAAACGTGQKPVEDSRPVMRSASTMRAVPTICNDRCMR